MLEKVNPNQAQNIDISYLTELMYHQARNNVEAIGFEIAYLETLPYSKETEERLYRYLEMQSEAQKQAYNLCLQMN